METDFVGKLPAKIPEQRRKQFFGVGMGVNVEIGRSSQKSQSRNQPRQSETVIAVQVRNENAVEFLKIQLHRAELELCAFPAINHIKFIAQVNNLRTQEMFGSRERRTAT